MAKSKPKPNLSNLKARLPINATVTGIVTIHIGATTAAALDEALHDLSIRGPHMKTYSNGESGVYEIECCGPVRQVSEPVHQVSAPLPHLS